MTRKAEWPKGTEIQKTAIGLPRKTWQSARLRAFREGRTFQELVADAIDSHLRKVKKGGGPR